MISVNKNECVCSLLYCYRRTASSTGKNSEEMERML